MQVVNFETVKYTRHFSVSRGLFSRPIQGKRGLSASRETIDMNIPDEIHISESQLKGPDRHKH